MKTLHGSAFKHTRPKRTVVGGHRFDSNREARRFLELEVRRKAGEIRKLELQPSYALAVGDRRVLIRSEGYPNGRQVVVRFDFRYEERGDEGWLQVVEDCKSIDTPVSRLKRAFVEACYGIQVRVVR